MANVHSIPRDDTEPLGKIFRSPQLGELQLALATSALADYASDDPLLLADLIKDASPQQFASLFPALAQHLEAVIEDLETELKRVGGPFWRVANIPKEEHATKSSACQSLPFAALGETLELLGSASYRPRSIRLYTANGSIWCAATWTRDDRAWEWLYSTNVDYIRARDDELRRKGHLPVDVAVCQDEDSAIAFLVLWHKAQDNDVEVRLRIGCLDDKEQNELRSLVNAGFNCVAADVLSVGRDQAAGAGIRTVAKQAIVSRNSPSMCRPSPASRR